MTDTLRGRLAKYLSDNVALFDCRGGCPDEVALSGDLPTPEYCYNCFARSILAIVVEDLEQRTIPNTEGNDRITGWNHALKHVVHDLRDQAQEGASSPETNQQESVQQKIHRFGSPPGLPKDWRGRVLKAQEGA